MDFDKTSFTTFGVDFFAPLKDLDHGSVALVPGDPDRVDLIASLWDEADVIALKRGYRAAVGRYRGRPISALSSGIGGPSLEHTIAEAAALGFTTLIRVGTTGGLQEEVRCGDLVVNEGSVRLDGTSLCWVRESYPAVAAFDVTAALVAAAAELGERHHVGVGATAASFFAGQERQTYTGALGTRPLGLIEELHRARVLNFEQEAATLFVLSRLLGMRAGAVAAVVANRVTGDVGGVDGVQRACRVASDAAHALAAA
jgi:uridine phosphorylase